MFVLFGYQKAPQNFSTTPSIHIYIIANNMEEILARVNQLDKDLVSHGQPWASNVIHTHTYVFWYRSVENPLEMTLPVRNVPCPMH